MRDKKLVKRVATSLLVLLMLGSFFGVTVTAGESTPAEAQLEPPTANLIEPPEGKVPSVEAIEVEHVVPVFQEGEDEPLSRPSHPPIDQIPPMPMPQDTDELPASEGPGAGIFYNAVTGETITFPVNETAPLGGFQQGGGYSGADGGEGIEELPMTFYDMSKITNTGAFPWRMNCKLVMRFVDQCGSDRWFVCSGTMRDAETVLTAGHCVYAREVEGCDIFDWAKEIWVYPGWDGAQTGPNAENYGYGHGTYFGSWTGWTQNGDFNYDVGIIGVTRAVGMLTGWYGWAYGGSCDWHKSQTYHNPSYPAECCNPPACTLHNGRDMYYWYGHFDSCPSWNRLQIDTSGGCFNAGWGGMSGSGAYFIDDGNRYVHAIASTSDRATIARYTRQWEDWVNWNNNYFIPNVRGGAFDLQALDVNAEPETIKQGGSTTLLNHLATNPTNGNKAATFTVRVYLSTNDFISSADTLLSTQYYGWNFNPMSSVRVNMGMVTIPYNTPPGDYWIGVIYDPATDGNSGNNDASYWDAVPIHVIKETTPPPAPVISSSTHPNENVWYCNRNPTFTWTTPSDPSGIACYSYILDHSSTTTPDTICDTTGNSKSYTNLAYGTWYFHVRAKDNAGNWGPADHYRVQLEDCDLKDGCYAYGNGCEDRDYYCDGSVCKYTVSNRHTDYYDDWVNYCKGDEVWKHRLFHDFYCEGGSCKDHTSWKDDQLVENCNVHDGWYDTGDTRWVDDPANECKEKEQKKQEYRDYTCSGGACTYSVTTTQWIDTGNVRNKPDGTVCGCTANNTLKECYDGTCTDTGICNSTICGADVACDGKKPGENCNADRTCNATCKCILPAEKPDLEITEEWVCWPDNCTICYNVTNIGNGTVPKGHNTTLYVDGEEVAHDLVDVNLAPNASYIGCFKDYIWTYTPPGDNITVCADNNSTIDESNETNNCLTNIWTCGDVNCDRAVDMSDVIDLLYYVGYPGQYTICNHWAADVNCDKRIDMSDVIDLLYYVGYPGQYELKCCCIEISG